MKTHVNFRNTQFIGSFEDPNQVPTDDKPLIMIAGKSNVGKSSLLNVLTGQKHARVSQTPGKTRLVLLFNVDDCFTLVDLPGYGYARAGKKDQQVFSSRTEAFVMSRRPDLTLFLLDSRHEPTALDLHMLSYLTEAGLLFLPILTKADKSSRQAMQQQLNRLREMYRLQDSRLLAVSAEKRTGIRELRDAIAAHFDLQAAVTD